MKHQRKLTSWYAQKIEVSHFHQTDDLCQKVWTDGTKREINI